MLAEQRRLMIERLMQIWTDYLQADTPLDCIEYILDDVGYVAADSSQGFVTILSVAEGLDISIIVAEEFIGIAERCGAICPDQSHEGTRFYRNQFCPIELCTP